MNAIVEKVTGMNALTDQVICFDLLMATKAGIKTYAGAISEATTPDIKQMLTKQLTQATNFHERLTAYMVTKGWYHPYQVKEQIQLQLDMAKTALTLG